MSFTRISPSKAASMYIFPSKGRTLASSPRSWYSCRARPPPISGGEFDQYLQKRFKTDRSDILPVLNLEFVTQFRDKHPKLAFLSNDWVYCIDSHQPINRKAAQHFLIKIYCANYIHNPKYLSYWVNNHTPYCDNVCIFPRFACEISAAQLV